MADMKACLTAQIIRVQLTCDDTAHLAGEAIAIKNK